MIMLRPKNFIVFIFLVSFSWDDLTSNLMIPALQGHLFKILGRGPFVSITPLVISNRHINM